MTKIKYEVIWTAKLVESKWPRFVLDDATASTPLKASKELLENNSAKPEFVRLIKSQIKKLSQSDPRYLDMHPDAVAWRKKTYGRKRK